MVEIMYALLPRTDVCLHSDISPVMPCFFLSQLHCSLIMNLTVCTKLFYIGQQQNQYWILSMSARDHETNIAVNECSAGRERTRDTLT